MIDYSFDEKLKVVQEAISKWEDPAKAVNEYMKNKK